MKRLAPLRVLRSAAAPLLAFTILSCSSSDTTEPPPAADVLSAQGLFVNITDQTPVDGVIPYDVISVLYADESQKLRFIRIPKGTQATYKGDDPWDFPDGTQLVKTFFYPTKTGRRLLETRIVERAAGEWTARTYVWNDAQTEAERVKIGKIIHVDWDDAGTPKSIDYHVPDENQCKKCHSEHHVVGPLGPRTRQINRDHDYGSGAENQIDHLAKLGLVKGTIPAKDQRFTLVDPYGTDPIDMRARSYLEGNCSHCHRPGGNAGASSLDLRITTTDQLNLGVCRVPSAAGPGTGGNMYDIVWGHPEESIMISRMSSTEPETKMPQIPTITSDANGTKLITDWIKSVPEQPCQ